MGTEQRYPESLKAAARQIWQDEERSPSRALRRLETEHGVTIGRGTLRSWTLGHEHEGTPTVDGLANRLLALASSELTRLERQTRHLDLDRAGKVAQILKTIEPLTRSKTRTARTLADLNAPTEQSDDETEQSLSGAAQTLTTGRDLSDLSDAA